MLDRTIGEKIRSDREHAISLWSALTNVHWHGPEGETVSYSFRRAGDVVSWIREEGDYMEWYCSGPPGVVADWISKALAAEDWSWVMVAL
jgi:hypothetical protein